MITAKSLTIGYRQGSQGEQRVQEDLSFSLTPRRLTCLLGPNGAGKSTLLRSICGMQPPLSGELLLDGRSIAHYSDIERSRLLGLVLTDKTFAGGLRVEELVALGRYPYLGFFGRLRAADRAVLSRVMEQVGIAHKASYYVAELSDGERQKVMIAKALAQESPVIVLDEPTAFLDITSRMEVMHLLHHLAEQGKTILLSTHDIEQALMLADELWLLSSEQGMATGVTEDVVLRGDMARFFDAGAIHFDTQYGSFRMDNRVLRPIGVEAPVELRLWLENTLLRNGFAPFDPASDGSPVLPPLYRLEACSPTALRLYQGIEKLSEFHSFGELTIALRALRKIE